MKQYDLVVVGGGSAGLAAAISAYDNGVKSILLLEKDEYLGGILLQCIHNGFGLHEFGEQLSGPEYAERFVDEFHKRGIDYRTSTLVLEVTKDKQVVYSNAQDGYQIVQAKAIVMAAGCSERTRGAISIPGTRPQGIMSAGVAQKYLNIEGYLVGKKVFILGSGDIGLIMARRMTLEGAKVVGVAELMPYSNGLTRNIVQCLNDFDIPLYLSHTICDIKGHKNLESVTICQVDDKFNYIKGTEKSFDVDTLLLSVGLIPSNELLNNIGADVNGRTKGAIVNESMETSVEGIFSCGNGLHVHDLVDFVTKEGRKAGLGASKYIKGLLDHSGEYQNIVNGFGVGYVVPQMINKNNVDDFVTVNFRVTKPFNSTRILIKSNGEVIKSIFKPHMLPAEMENVLIDKNILDQAGKEIVIEIQGGE